MVSTDGLAAGFYYDTLHFLSNDVFTPDYELPVVLEVESTIPTVTNSTGASSITASSARLNGEVTYTGGENPTVHIYWGDNDGGTTPGSWDNDLNLGTQSAGTFYSDISGLNPNTTYYYRCYATNPGGNDWADATAEFNTLAAPTIVVSPDSLYFTESSFQNISVKNIDSIAYLNVSNIINATDWITLVNPTSFSVAPQDSVEVVVMVSTDGLEDGCYYDTLHIFSNDIFTPDYEVPVVLEVGSTEPPDPVSDLVISIDENSNVVLSWSAVSGATSYKIYASDFPYDGFTEVDTTSNTEWTSPVTSDKRFFYVTAVN